MGWFDAALLGLVQGLTEFLPVSSSGHLVIVESFLGPRAQGILFEVSVHVGTLFAILLFYRARVAALVVGVLDMAPEAWRYAGKLALATLPAVPVGLFLKPRVEALFNVPWVVGAGLLGTSLILLTTRRSVQTAYMPEPTWSQALWIGLAQVVAIVPGVSRSGTTLAAALALGVAPLAATEFVFLLGVAAIAGAAVLEVPEMTVASPDLLWACVLGASVSMVSGVGAIWLFIRLLRSQRFHWFAAYTACVGAAFLLWTQLH